MFSFDKIHFLAGAGPVLSMLVLGVAADAAPFTSVRVGDADGFGYGSGSGLLNFEGDPVNVDGSGPLGPGDFMPDLNQDGLVMDFQGDDFDNRTSGELGGSSLTGSGYTDTGSSGSEFTDLSLSHSYNNTGFPNDFPDSDPTDRNDARFVFDFAVDSGDINAGAPMYFNIVYGDIGLVAADLELTTRSGSETITLSPINPNVEDGLVQGAFAEIDFAEIFQLNGGVYEGLLTVDLVTRPTTVNGDPFYGIDFAELSQAQITLVPAPAALAIFVAGAVALGGYRRAARPPAGSPRA